jgi:hypothetical protein
MASAMHLGRGQGKRFPSLLAIIGSVMTRSLSSISAEGLVSAWRRHLFLRSMRFVLFSMLGSAFGTLVASSFIIWLRSKSKRKQDEALSANPNSIVNQPPPWPLRRISRATAGQIELEINHNSLSKRRPYVKTIRAEIERVIRAHFGNNSIQVSLQGSVQKGTGISGSDLDLFVTGVAVSDLDRQEIMRQLVIALNPRYQGSLGSRRILLQPVEHHNLLPSIDLIFHDHNGKRKRVRQPDPISSLKTCQAHAAQIVVRIIKWMPEASPHPLSLLGGYEGLRKPNHRIESFVRLSALQLKPEVQKRGRNLQGAEVASLLSACLLTVARQVDGSTEEKTALEKAGLRSSEWAVAACQYMEKLSELDDLLPHT